MDLNERNKSKIKVHAISEKPNECCGLIYKNKECGLDIFECHNISDKPDNFFIIDPNDYLAASSKGEIIGYYHSHITGSNFSDFDKVNSERTGLNSIIYCLENDNFYEYSPIGYELPYTKRQYITGFIDCFSLIKDYYKKEKNIEISELKCPYRLSDIGPDHPENNRYHSILPDHFLENGFIEVESLKNEDVILTRTQMIQSPVHASIYIEPGQILHHPFMQNSRIETYRSAYKKWTTHILRHKSSL